MKRIGWLLLVIVIILSIMLAGCGSDKKTLGDTLKEEAISISDNQQRLMKQQPAPIISFSNERANQIKRAETFGSDPNKLSWIYLVLPGGQILDFSSVKGKVSHVSSYLVPDMQLIDEDDYKDFSSNDWAVTVQAPDIDGSYGTNGDAVFWYDANGVFHQWNGLYYLVDEPLKLASQPLIIKEE